MYRFFFLIMIRIATILLATLMLSFSSDNWQTIKNSNGVSVKFKTSDCKLDNSFLQKWFLLSFSNESAVEKKVEWDLALYDRNGKCVTCEDPYGEYKYTLVLKPGQKLEGVCDFSCKPELRIVSELLDVQASMSYPSFELKNFKVSENK